MSFIKKNTLTRLILFLIYLFPIGQLQSSQSWLAVNGKTGAPGTPEIIVHQIDDSSVLFTVKTSGVFLEKKSTDETEWQKLSLPEHGHILETGQPMVPVIIRRIAVPSSCSSEDIQIEIKTVEYTVVPGIQIGPVPEFAEKKLANGKFIFEEKHVPDMTVYGKDEYYPQNIVTIEKIGFVRDQKVAWLGICPVQFNPVAREVKVCSVIEFSLKLKNGGRIAENFSPEMVFKHSSNYSGISKSTNEEGTVSYPANLLNSNNEADYLLIVEDTFFGNAALDSLAHHHAAFGGLNVAVAKTGDIYEQFPDKLLDVSIKAFIMYAYNNWQASYFGDGHLGFVLLVGEGEENSERLLPTHKGPAHSADQWYACLNDDNGDNSVDDYDRVPDVMVGRFSVETTEELNAIARKTIYHESRLNLNEAWRKKISLVSGYHSSQVFEEIQNLFEYLKEVVNKQDFFQISDDLKRSEHDRDFVRNSFLNAFNEGRGILNIQAHGGVDNLGDSYGWLLLQSSDVENLANGDRLPVALSFACHTGEFFDPEVDCLGETLLNTANKGAVAFVGCTNAIKYSINERLNRTLFEILFERQTGRLGLALYFANIFEYPFSTYNILGDPALNLTKNVAQPLADLSVAASDIEVLWSITEGYAEIIKAEIYNMGFRDVNNLVVQFFNGDPEKGGSQIGEDVIVANVPGFGGHATAGVKIGDNIEGEISVHVLVDPNNSIREIEEGNNRAWLTAHIFPYVNVANVAMPQMLGTRSAAAFGDYNNDGFPDIFVAGKAGNVLFNNVSDGSLTDVSDEVGIADSMVVSSTAFIDYDNDGDLDIFLNMLESKADDLFYIDNVFYENNGQGGFFFKIPYSNQGLPLKNEPVACFDFDNDGFPDFLCIESSSRACVLYRNLGNSRFVDVTDLAGLDSTKCAKHAALGDYDNDGDLDIYVAMTGNGENALFNNNGDGSFTDVAETAGVGSPRGADWAVFGDYNNDGYLDLFVYHGTVYNALYQNKGDATFEDMAESAYVENIKGDFKSGRSWIMTMTVAWTCFSNTVWMICIKITGMEPLLKIFLFRRCNY